MAASYIVTDRDGRPMRLNDDGVLVWTADRGRHAAATLFPDRPAALKAVRRSARAQHLPPWSDKNTYELVAAS